MQLSRVKNLQKRKESSFVTCPTSFCLKTTGHEKSKITVCLTAVADGRKKKPFVVFKGAKREVKKLNEEFKSRCIVATSVSGWMND